MKDKKELTKQKIIEELGKHYQDFLAECDAYDGASFWSNKRVSELADKLILRQELKKKVEGMKMIDMIKYGSTGSKCCQAGLTENTKGYNQALKDIINLLEERKE